MLDETSNFSIPWPTAVGWGKLLLRSFTFFHFLFPEKRTKNVSDRWAMFSAHANQDHFCSAGRMIAYSSPSKKTLNFWSLGTWCIKFTEPFWQIYWSHHIQAVERCLFGCRRSLQIWPTYYARLQRKAGCFGSTPKRLSCSKEDFQRNFQASLTKSGIAFLVASGVQVMVCQSVMSFKNLSIAAPSFPKSVYGDWRRHIDTCTTFLRT